MPQSQRIVLSKCSKVSNRYMQSVLWSIISTC